MARLTWENVQAPQIDIRGLALASQNVTGGFDRLAEMFANRYAQQKTEATDAAIAAQLALTDPDQVGKIDIAGLDAKVDKRALLEAATAHRRGLTQELGAKEDLLNKQALSQFGDEMLPMLEAYRNGDPDAQKTIAMLIEANPLAERALAQVAPELFKAKVGGEEFREGQLRADFDDKIAQGQLDNSRASTAISAENARYNRQLRADQDAGFALGESLAEKYRGMAPEDAKLKIYDDPQYRDASPRAKAAIRATFGEAQTALSTPTGEEAAAWSPVLRENKSVIAGLAGAANRAENQQRDPTLEAVRRSRELEGVVKADDVVQQLRDKGPYATDGQAKAGFDSILSEVTAKIRESNPDAPGATAADVQAAIDQFGLRASWFTRLGASGSFLSSEDNQLIKNTLRVVEARNQGYGQNRDIDIATARGGFEAKQAQIQRAEQALLRAQRAAPRRENGEPGAVDPALVERLEKLRNEARAMYSGSK